MTNPPDPVTLASSLVRIPSESSDPLATDPAAPEQGMVAYLTSLCRDAGIEHRTSEAKPNRENLVIRLPKPGSATTVDRRPSRYGQRPGHEGALRRAICGRVRSGAAAPVTTRDPWPPALSAVLDLHARGIEPLFDITFAGTVDEECTMAGAEQLAREIDGFDLCLALEPTDLKVINAHKGVYRFVVITRGKAVHSSHPEKGENAISRMLPILRDLEAAGGGTEPKATSRTGHGPAWPSPRSRAAPRLNIIPDYCEAAVDIRLLPEMTIGDTAARVRELIGDRGEVVEVYTGEGINTDPDTAADPGFPGHAARRRGRARADHRRLRHRLLPAAPPGALPGLGTRRHRPGPPDQRTYPGQPAGPGHRDPQKLSHRRTADEP